ncbi:hypothetical protein MtrunA17_Chr6g0471861 [Medicago truncatula]|uniref:Transmembrane protein n=1 Tax=Medicago truncatula TaxID=3880 RepID=A0A396HEG9_MEDTR|nr:hypothetical protein MtrunA17_Chr6g0471861 [Medicago truncatula]
MPCSILIPIFNSNSYYSIFIAAANILYNSITILYISITIVAIPFIYKLLLRNQFLDCCTTLI